MKLLIATASILAAATFASSAPAVGYSGSKTVGVDGVASWPGTGAWLGSWECDKAVGLCVEGTFFWCIQNLVTDHDANDYPDPGDVISCQDEN